MNYEREYFRLKVDSAILRAKVSGLKKMVERLRETNSILQVAKLPEPSAEIPAALASLNLPLYSHVAATPSCVYFLLRGDEVVYVGQTVCLGSRLGGHRVDGRLFDRVFYVPVANDDLDEVETAMIARLQPKLNASPGPAASRNRKAQKGVQNAPCLS
jgi:hypothetical protein